MAAGFGAVRLVACPDKFRGTLSAFDAAAAIARGAVRAGVAPADIAAQPMADGGEGMLEAFGGANRANAVAGPHGDEVEAGWRLDGEVAVVEMARAAGLALAGGSEANDPLAATTRGVGQLVRAALDEGATKIIVGVGGSATTDGGIGAVEALCGFPPGAALSLDPSGRALGRHVTKSSYLRRAQIVVACDVTTKFMDAPRTFGPQKGATADDIAELERRLAGIARHYVATFGVDVRELPRSGAAGGLAGGLAALGASLKDGFLVVAQEVSLAAQLADADVVVTGEGKLDATSLAGKVPAGVAGLADGAALLVVAGVVDGPAERYAQQLAARSAAASVDVVSLTERFGERRAHAETAVCVSEAVSTYVREQRIRTQALA